MRLLSAGDRCGHLTVLGEAPRGIHGERRYFCKCDCGNVDSFDVNNITRNPDHRCKKCVPHYGGKPKPDLVGKTINGIEVLEESERDTYGNLRFKCRCARCGSISIKTVGQIHARKSDRCRSCPPDYHFQIEGNIATGTLPNGETFMIDADNIPLVNNYNWTSNARDAYLHDASTGVRLHRLISGVNDPKVMVDHINRNRKDCRRENLRIISTFGNSCNHGRYSTNKTGYTGVYFSKYAMSYEAKVGYNHKRIRLGSSKDDLVKLAQMYNIAATFLFGEYVGALNDVPDPPEELVKSVIAKCQKYVKAPDSSGAFAA